jgi:hypothetical protein
MPTIAETREEWARTGNVDALWGLLTSSGPAMLNMEATFKLLARAIEVRAREDPAGFSAEVFTRLVALTTYLTLRTHMHAGRLIAVYDRADRGVAELPRELTDLVLPRLVQLQEHLAELMAVQATTARSWALTRQKEIENGRAAGSGGQPCPCTSRHRHPPVTTPPGVVEPETPAEVGREEGGITEEIHHGPINADLGSMRFNDQTPGGQVAETETDDRDGRSVADDARGHRAQAQRPRQGVGPPVPRS